MFKHFGVFLDWACFNDFFQYFCANDALNIICLLLTSPQPRLNPRMRRSLGALAARSTFPCWPTWFCITADTQTSPSWCSSTRLRSEGHTCRTQWVSIGAQNKSSCFFLTADPGGGRKEKGGVYSYLGAGTHGWNQSCQGHGLVPLC